MEEIEEYKEYIMKSNLNDSFSVKSKTNKDKYKRKNKNASNAYIRKVESRRNYENLNLQLKAANRKGKYLNSIKLMNKKDPLACQIVRRSSDVDKRTKITMSKHSLTKKKTLNDRIKSKSNIRLFNLNENNPININNNFFSNSNKNNNLYNYNKNNNDIIDNKSKFVSNIDNKNQLESMRINREIKNKNTINEIERLKINLNNDNYS